MCVDQDGSAGPVLAEYIQNLVYTSSFLAAGVEFSVGVSSGAPFTKTVIGFRINFVFPADACQVGLAVAYVLSAFHNDRAQSEFDQTQGCKQSSRSGTYYDDLRFSFHIGIFGMHKFVIFRHFVDEYQYFQIDVNGPLACIDASLQDAYGLNGTDVYSLFTADILFDTLFACSGRILNWYSLIISMNFFDGLVLQVKIRRSRELSSSGGQIKIRSPPCRVGRAERYLILPEDCRANRSA